MIMLDAFRHDYPGRSPGRFFEKLAASGSCGSLVPPFGFETDGAYLAGLHPEESDEGFHFWYSPETSPFRLVKRWGRCFDAVPRALQRGLRAALGRTGPALHDIPLSFLRFMDVRRKGNPFDHGCYPSDTFFDMVRRAGGKWMYLGAPVSSCSARRIYRDLRAGLSEDLDIVFLLIGDLDPVGHAFGPCSRQLEGKLAEVEGIIKDIFGLLQKKYGRLKAVIFGDHGMVSVRRHIDVKGALKKARSRPIEDYLFFLDSTVARFWFFNEEARREVTDILGGLSGGSIISGSERRDYRINYSHVKFGEVMFWAGGGSLIFPNFYQSASPVAAMHGYRSETAEDHAAFIFYDSEQQPGPPEKHPARMVDMFQAIVSMLDLEQFAPKSPAAPAPCNT